MLFLSVRTSSLAKKNRGSRSVMFYLELEDEPGSKESNPELALLVPTPPKIF